ncbi:MAG: glycosyltransferase [Rhodocyclaceae bacterium]
MTKPSISVLMPAYNHAPYISAAVESVLAQSVADFELVIVDDASPDDTWACLQPYAADARVRLYRHELNQGSHATLNEALSLARGDRIAIINSDDVFEPERLARCGAALDAGADLVGSDIRLIDARGEPVDQHWWVEAFDALKAVYRSSGDWPAALLAGNVFMTTSNFMFERSVLERVGLFRDFRYVLDYDYLLRALAAGCRFAWVDDKLLRYRLHESNTISDSPLKANRECAALLRELARALLALEGGEGHTQVVRWQALAEQWARGERYIVEILQAQRHHALVEQETNWRGEVAMRDGWIADRDAWIAERDAWIAERDGWIAERDAALAQRDRWVAERDALIAVRDADLKHYQKRFGPLVRLLGWRGTAVVEYPTRALLRGARALRHGAVQLRRLFAMDTVLRRPPLRVGGFEALQAWLAPRLDEIDCVSFDVFDTLLSRCIEPPEWLHRRVAEEILPALAGHWTVEAVLAARHEEERGLRRASLEAAGDHECHYRPLVEGWVRRLQGHDDPELVERIETVERELEHLALTVKPGARAVLAWLRAQGKTVLAVSDMYLGREYVEALLADCGLADVVDRVYVSSEYGLAKYSGRLHALVLETEQLQAGRVVHVGDNLMSDMVGATGVGIQGVFLDERRERVRRRHQQLSAEMAGAGGVWPGRMLNEIVAERMRGELTREELTREELTREESARDKLARDAAGSERPAFFQRFGATVLGPLFSTFTLGLVERLQATRPDKVFFLARDGYLFKQLYQHYAALRPQTLLPEAEYLYVSRRVLTSAGVAEGLTIEQARVAFYNPKQQGLLSVCKTYGLEPASFEAHARLHGFERFDEPVGDWNDPRLRAFLADEAVQDEVRRHGRAARGRLRAYLAQHGFFDAHSVAFVDIGWNGTIQKFLVETFAAEPGFPRLHGYYYALGTAMHGRFEDGGSMEGLLMDTRRGNPCERAPGDFEELFEQGARSPEATTLGYRECDGRIEPVLKDEDAPDRQAERASNPDVAAMQAGVAAYFGHFLAAQRLTGFGFDQLRPYALALGERAVVYPTAEEAHHVGRLAHTEDFGHDAVLDLNAEPVRLADLARPRALYARLRGLPWRYAPLAGVFSPWSAWLMRVMHLRRSKAGGE